MKTVDPTREAKRTEQIKRIMRRVWWNKLYRRLTWFWLAIMVSSFVAGGVCAAVTRDEFYMNLGLALAAMAFVLGGVLLNLKHFNPFVTINPNWDSYSSEDMQRWCMVVVFGGLIALIGGSLMCCFFISHIRLGSKILEFPREVVIESAVGFSISWTMLCCGLFLIRLARLGLPVQLE